jgi:hypothetical protein
MAKTEKKGRAPSVTWLSAPVKPYYEREIQRLEEFRVDLEAITDGALAAEAARFHARSLAWLTSGYHQYLGVPTVTHILSGCATLYIGRYNSKWNLPKSKWANPFKIGKDGDREQVLDLYHGYILEKTALLADLHELQATVLGCWCTTHQAPDTPCHGHILATLYGQWAERQWYTYGFQGFEGNIGILRVR